MTKKRNQQPKRMRVKGHLRKICGRKAKVRVDGHLRRR